jgi:hypothetical protein
MMPSIALLFIHWVGDYLLQTNEMATRKSQSFKWLTVHVLLYTAALLVGVLLLIPVGVIPVENIVTFVGVNGALHWITDLVTSRIGYRVSDTPRIYYPLIGFDQFLHAVTLLVTLQWLGGG